MSTPTAAPIDSLSKSTCTEESNGIDRHLCDPKGNKSHVITRIKPSMKDFDRNEAVALCLQHIAQLSRHPCLRFNRKTEVTKCNCLAILAEGSSDPDNIDPLVTGVINYMIFWAGKTLAERKEKISEWLPYTQCIEGRRCFVLPVRGWSSGGANPTLICINAFSSLLGVGPTMWKTIRANTTGDFDKHGLKGQTNRSLCLTEAFESLHAYFGDLKNAAVPRVVKKKTRYELRDGEYLKHLSARLSKRGLYEAYVWRCGYITKIKPTGHHQYDRIKEFEERPFDDDEDFPLFPTGTERKRVVSWSAFVDFWEQHYKDIVIRKNKPIAQPSKRSVHEGIDPAMQSPNKRSKTEG